MTRKGKSRKVNEHFTSKTGEEKDRTQQYQGKENGKRNIRKSRRRDRERKTRN